MGKKQKQKDLEEMDVDEFMAEGISDESEGDDEDSPQSSKAFEDLRLNIEEKLSKKSKENK